MFVLCSCTTHQHPGKKIFRYNQAEGIASLDPAFAKNQSVMWADHQLYNTLTEVDENLQLVPSLAKRWEFTDDNRVIIFHVRTDVFFHDDECFAGGKGRKMKASDIVYSFTRIVDEHTASPGAWIFNSRIDSVAPFTAIDDSTFRLKLKQPFQPILGILSMQYCSIVPKEAVEKYGTDFRRHPVGTGPFCFTAWEEGQALILKKNPHYFERDSSGYPLPYLDGIKVSFFDSKATEFLEFQQGRLDFINDIDASFKDEILTKTGNLRKQWEGKLLLDKHPYLNIEYLGILSDTLNELLKNSPLRLQKIRQAINYGIDRRKMILYLRNSLGIAAESGFVPAGLPSHNDSLVKGYTYDPVKAKALLAEAGYDAANAPPIKLLTIPNYAALGTYIVNELKQLGVNVVVETVQKSLLLEQTSKSQVLFFRGSWIADYPDAENYLGVFYGNNPAPPNYTRFKNSRYDSLYTQSLSETNDSLRYTMYRAMDRIIIEEAPIIPLWYDMVLHLVHTNIRNFRSNSLNMLELRKVGKANEE
ncbi:MAG: ABC transporter substrate-binding protein [Bacteroidetes bacterium]|nr:ABC transporter substrate-binding protein [Bacteroidota bacterium]